MTGGHFYPRPPRGGRHGKPRPWRKHHLISIHALREEGDLRSSIRATSRPLFLSTPSARRATRSFSGTMASCAQFLSTPSARRATQPFLAGRPLADYFYPRPPRGGRRINQWMDIGDNKFLSTPSARRATCRLQRHADDLQISIHALREEGDVFVCHLLILLCIFLSTPSARRATFQAGLFAAHHDISIHALREEGDPNLQHLSISFFEFLSTPSARRATHLFADGAQEGVISIHALREEGDAARP